MKKPIKSPIPPKAGGGFVFGFPQKIWLAKTDDGISLIHQREVYLAMRDKFEIAEYDFVTKEESMERVKMEDQAAQDSRGVDIEALKRSADTLAEWAEDYLSGTFKPSSSRLSNCLNYYKEVISTIPVQDAEPKTATAEVQGADVGRTAGAHPATGAIPIKDGENLLAAHGQLAWGKDRAEGI
jgi:hypothetical protein